jgi:ABC-type transport system involved in cytochrome c biogenesis permease subunit
MVWGPLTINLGIAAALVGFLAIGLLAMGDKRNGQVGILGFVVLALGVILAIAFSVTVAL